MAKTTQPGPIFTLPSSLLHQDLSNVNEQLRHLVEAFKAHRGHLDESGEPAEAPCHPSQEEGRLDERLEEIEREHRRVLEQYGAAEDQTFRLTTLFVALHQIHQSTERADVLTVLQEIIVNLLGSEQLAVFELDPEGKVLHLTHSAGILPGAWREVAVGEGCIGRVVSDGVARFAPARFRDVTVNACVPLRAGHRIVGALAIFDLLPHKALLAPFDHELLEALSIHAGAALCLANHERRGKT